MKRNKGITLVALVVTIIILIILAGISIHFLLGDNGILQLAKQAKENAIEAEKEEDKSLEDLYSSILIATNDSSQITINIEDLKTIIKKQVQEEVKEELKKNKDTSPTGTIISYFGSTAPTGYLACDGSVYNISDYQELAEQIKKEVGTYQYYGGDGETTFAVPDLRGEFLRGTGTNTHAKQGNGLGVGLHQDGTTHQAFLADGGSITANNAIFVQVDNSGSGAYKPSGFDSVVTQATKERYFATSGSRAAYLSNFPGLYTSRPTNTSVLYCIKY